MKVRGFEPPLGWDAQSLGSYARLLAAWEHETGGRLSLVAQSVAPGTGARSLADESKPALLRQGFREIKLSDAPAAGDESDRLILDAVVDDGHRFVRQLYVTSRRHRLRGDDGGAAGARDGDAPRLRRGGRFAQRRRRRRGAADAEALTRALMLGCR